MVERCANRRVISPSRMAERFPNGTHKLPAHHRAALLRCEGARRPVSFPEGLSGAPWDRESCEQSYRKALAVVNWGVALHVRLDETVAGSEK